MVVPCILAREARCAPPVASLPAFGASRSLSKRCRGSLMDRAGSVPLGRLRFSPNPIDKPCADLMRGRRLEICLSTLHPNHAAGARYSRPSVTARRNHHTPSVRARHYPCDGRCRSAECGRRWPRHIRYACWADARHESCRSRPEAMRRS